jgi:hypothetical protein
MPHPDNYVLRAALTEDRRGLLAAMMGAVQSRGIAVEVDLLARTITDVAGVLERAALGSSVSEDDLGGLRTQWAQWSRNGHDVSRLRSGFEAAIRMAYARLSSHFSQFDAAPAGEQRHLFDALALGVLATLTAFERAAMAGEQDSRADQVEPSAASSVNFVSRLLGASAGEAWLGAEAEAAALGLDLSGPAGLVLLLPGQGDQTALRQLAHSLADSSSVLEGPLRHEPVAHFVNVVQPSDPQPWETIIEAYSSAVASQPGARLVSAPASGVLDVPVAYARCLRPLRMVRLIPTNGPHIDAGTLQLWQTLDTAPAIERVTLFETVLGLLVDEGRGDLLRTLDGLVVSGSQDRTAELLGLTRRTVNRQVGQITTLTGYDWSDHRQRPAILVAVLCRWLAAMRPSSYDEGTFGPPPNFSAMGLRTVRHA